MSMSETLTIWLLRLQTKILLVCGMREAAMQVFEAILVRKPGDVQAMNSLGYEALRGNHPLRALGYFEQVLKVDAANSNAQFNCAYALEELGRLPEAESAFKAAIALDEKADRAWYGLSLVLIRLGRLEEALVALKRNTKLQPMSPYGWYQMARVHINLGQADKARDVITHLNGFEPKVAAQLERETGIAPIRF